jgi:hypothetical protein
MKKRCLKFFLAMFLAFAIVLGTIGAGAAEVPNSRAECPAQEVSIGEGEAQLLNNVATVTIRHRSSGHTSGTPHAEITVPRSLFGNSFSVLSQGTLARTGWHFGGWRNQATGILHQPGDAISLPSGSSTFTFDVVWVMELRSYVANFPITVVGPLGNVVGVSVTSTLVERYFLNGTQATYTYREQVLSARSGVGALPPGQRFTGAVLNIRHRDASNGTIRAFSGTSFGTWLLDPNTFLFEARQNFTGVTYPRSTPNTSAFNFAVGIQGFPGVEYTHSLPLRV